MTPKGVGSTWHLSAVFFLLTAALAWAQPAERVEEKDANNDGRPEEWRVYAPAAPPEKGEVLLRAERDLDGDGHREVKIFFEKGQPVRSEVDRNRDGKPDLVRLMERGRPVKDRADLNFDGRWDAWSYYKDGFKDLMWMDKNFDGKAEARFYYGQTGLKMIGGEIDENFDGKPDRTFGSVPPKEERQPW